MSEIIPAAPNATDDVDTAIANDRRARQFADNLKAIMGQVGAEVGKKLVVEMQNHLIRMNNGRTMDRYAAVATMILVATNSIAEWIVDDENGPTTVDQSDPRVVAVETIQRQLLRSCLRDRSTERFARQLTIGQAAGNA